MFKDLRQGVITVQYSFGADEKSCMNYNRSLLTKNNLVLTDSRTKP